MARLILDGKVVCEVNNVRREKGSQTFTEVPLGNGRTEQIPGNKEPDRITFSLLTHTYLDQTLYVLVDDDGRELTILIEKIRGNNVQAVVQRT